MLEVAVAREYHRYSILIASVYRKLIFDTSARLHDSDDTALVSCLYAVVEWKERVGSKHCSVRIRQRMFDCLLRCSNSIYLTAADTEDSLVLCD